MLIDRFRFISTIVVFFLTLCNFFLAVGIYGISNLYWRLLAILVIIIFSGINLQFANVAMRVDPMVSMLHEWQDTQLLDALFEKPIATHLSVPTDLKLADLPLNHYLFMGAARNEYRARLLSAFMVKHPKAIVLDAENQVDKTRFTALLSERKQNIYADIQPAFVLTGTFKAEFTKITEVKIYFLVESQTDLPINFKIVDNEIAKRIDRNSNVTLGLYDQKNGTISQLIA